MATAQNIFQSLNIEEKSAINNLPEVSGVDYIQSRFICSEQDAKKVINLVTGPYTKEIFGKLTDEQKIGYKINDVKQGNCLRVEIPAATAAELVKVKIIDQNNIHLLPTEKEWQTLGNQDIENFLAFDYELVLDKNGISKMKTPRICFKNNTWNSYFSDGHVILFGTKQNLSEKNLRPYLESIANLMKLTKELRNKVLPKEIVEIPF